MKNVRKLTEGAILLAAFTVLLLVTIYVPIIGTFLNFVLPLPFIMFSAKNNMKYITAFFVAAAFISFIAGSVMGLAFMLMYGAVGAVIGYMLQKNKSRTAILIASTLTLIVGLILFYAGSVVFFHLDFIHEFTLALKESAKMSEDMLKAMGQGEQIKLLNEQNANMIKMLKTLAPSLLIMVSVITVFVIQWVCFPIAKRFGITVQPWGSFRNISLPKSLLWYYLIALGGLLLLHPHEGTYLYSVLINARYILDYFILFQGLAFVFFIFHQRSVAKGLGVLVVILTFVLPIVHYIILLLGITDLGFDFRKRFEKKE
ncbi:YybS family protein [Neobacillus sp. OS1-2]|uniref:YybS family protein n=1 Tax=Neobacillus sp. OS1-2 TaxID=3070680 RepID=UPI0027DF1891|nr:YybS family protein [Neobacillus sp. OS1-2]WML41819.1 YybS family protein [Neobacillus sp. OS1-2]